MSCRPGAEGADGAEEDDVLVVLDGWAWGGAMRRVFEDCEGR